MTTTSIETVEDIGRLVRAGFDDWASLGDVRATRDGDLLMFSYTPPAQYAGRWNAFERLSRGLILHATSGEVVARPFDKFFNWGEGGRTSDAPIVAVMEKMDGSLIIGFHHDGRWRAATRGSFTSDQAQWAQRQLDALPALADVPTHWTLLAEAVYPANRIVIDYGGRENLYLLAMRHRQTGDYADLSLVSETAAQLGLPRPATYDHLDTIDGIHDALEGMSQRGRLRRSLRRRAAIQVQVGRLSGVTQARLWPDLSRRAGVGARRQSRGHPPDRARRAAGRVRWLGGADRDAPRRGAR